MKALLRLCIFFLLTLPAVPSWAAGSDFYQIGEGDLLLVKVYDMDDLTTLDRVDDQGNINFPLVGKIRVAGLTVPEAGVQIEKALADGYLVNPQVSVLIQEYRSRKVVVIGEVNRPGLYELKGNMTLLELISTAGGLGNEAGNHITITRKPATGPETKISVEIDQLLGQESAKANVRILDKDTVYVEKAGLFYVTGEVSRPSAYKLDEGMTVIKAITLAGGFTKLASKGKVSLIRKVEGEEKTFENVPMHFLLQAEDVIVVPESFF